LNGVVQDTNLKHSLQFGIGLHHAGLNDSDRSTVEHLFVAAKIQVCYLLNREFSAKRPTPCQARVFQSCT